MSRDADVAPDSVCVTGVLPAVVTVLTPVRFLLTVGSAVSEQRAAIDRGVRTLGTPVRLLTWKRSIDSHFNRTLTSTTLIRSIMSHFIS